MIIVELFLMGVALSMDAFAVSVGKGLTMGRVKLKDAGIIGLYFGGFQALMPFLGWFGGSYFKELIENFDHWIAFILLAYIGGKMLLDGIKGLRESRLEGKTGLEDNRPAGVTGPEEKEESIGAGLKNSSAEDTVLLQETSPLKEYKTNHKELLIMAVATSIDALAVGIALAIDNTNIALACPIIGCTTFVISVGGVYLGGKVGTRYEDKATLAGGIILILIGLKILLEHLGILAF